MSADLRPIPGTTLTFRVPETLTTRQVNRLIRDTTDTVIAQQVKMAAPHSMLQHATANYDRRREHTYLHGTVPAHYSHGFGTSVRDTLVARYTPSTREVCVHYPPNMRGMDHPTTDDWLRTRVYIYDAQVKAMLGVEALAVAMNGEPIHPVVAAERAGVDLDTL